MKFKFSKIHELLLNHFLLLDAEPEEPRTPRIETDPSSSIKGCPNCGGACMLYMGTCMNNINK